MQSLPEIIYFKNTPALPLEIEWCPLIFFSLEWQLELPTQFALLDDWKILLVCLPYCKFYHKLRVSDKDFSPWIIAV